MANGSKNGASSKDVCYIFDNFEIDVANRILLRDGRSVPLTAKVFDVLVVLAENSGRLLEKDELLERVWHGEFVEEGNLARNISTLRKALDDTGREHKYITTVQGRGYRFVGEVSGHSAGLTGGSLSRRPIPAGETEGALNQGKPLRRWVLLAAAAAILVTIAWVGSERFLTPAQPIRSIAVLPLKRLDGGDNYVGIGIADAVIREISRTRQLTVRPTSAILRYANSDADTLAAARELNTDAVLEGNVQRSGNTLRVSINLLKTADGSSIWNDRFDLQGDDIFRVQDHVAQQVADRLKLRLSEAGTSNIVKYPASPLAYTWYIKGVYSLDQRLFDRSDLWHMLDTIDYFKHSIEVDPNYALAHGQLALSYAWLAMFEDPGEKKWAGLARQEIARSLELDPNIAEPHVANALLYWSIYGGHQIESAIRELRLAKQLDPNYSGADLAALYAHVGLEQQAVNEYQRGTAIDPTSIPLHGLKFILPFLRGDLDGWVAAAPADVPMEDRPLSRWYYMHKGSLDLAQKVLDKQAVEAPESRDLSTMGPLMLALRGDFKRAQSEIPGALAKVELSSENYHHRTFDVACIYALAGNSAESVRWLRETANSGFPNYTLFARESFLDRIRQSPEFVQFMDEQKARYDRNLQEFGDQASPQ